MHVCMYVFVACEIVSYLYLEKQKMTRLSVRTTKSTADTAPRVKPAANKTQRCPIRMYSILPTFKGRIKHSKHRFCIHYMLLVIAEIKRRFYFILST